MEGPKIDIAKTVIYYVVEPKELDQMPKIYSNKQYIKKNNYHDAKVTPLNDPESTINMIRDILLERKLYETSNVEKSKVIRPKADSI